MPTYVYACQACDQVLERRQSFSDSPLEECELCGGMLRRVLQPVGIIFKGSGFYSTDHRTNPPESEGGSATGSGGDRKRGADSKGKVKSTKTESPKPSPSKAVATKDRGDSKTSSDKPSPN